jgi:integrase/recombinase XerD
MSQSAVRNQTILLDDYIPVWVNEFLTSKKSENLSPASVRFYRVSLEAFMSYCGSHSMKTISQLTPSFLREFLLYLGDQHNAGGVHGYFRSLRAFLKWYWDEDEPDFQNPIAKVKPPKVNVEPLEPVDIQDVRRIMGTCKGDLLDTGVRASELLSISLEDVNVINREVLVRLA